MFGSRRSAALASAGLALALSAWAQTGVHPGFTFTSLRPTGFNPQVSGMDVMPNGDLVISTWENFGKTTGSVYIVSNVRTGTPTNITYKKFAGNLNEPLGVKVLNGVVHVITRDQLLVLPDTNQDGTAETPRRLAANWGALNTDPRTLEFAFGLPYKAGKFYVGLATSWPLNLAGQAAERGCILEVDAVTGAHTPFACGLRTPNGMALGPDDELFATENQGNWVPASKLTHVARGKFYGVRKTYPAGISTSTETPPSIWLPHSDISISPTQPVWLKTGQFKGQMIAGDNNMGTLQRFFLEKVGGQFQGVVFRFTAGLEAGANRIIANEDGSLYVGGIGAPGSLWGGWAWTSKLYGLQRLSPTTQTAFEMLAIRSKGPSTFEVEFTEPAAAGAGQPANWQVRQWGYVPAETYGAGKQPTENLTVRGVQLSADGKKATLDIANLKAKNVVHIRLSNVASQGGKTLWAGDAWYTLNAFGPGTDVEVPGTVAARDGGRDGGMAGAGRLVSASESAGAAFAGAGAGGALRFRVLADGPFRAEIRDARGTLIESRSGKGPLEVTAESSVGPGAYAVTVTAAAGRETAWLRAGR